MIILFMIWMFFSLPWICLAGIISFASCDPAHCSEGMYPVALAMAGGFTFGPTLVFAGVLYGLRSTIAGMSWVTFWAFVRVLMYIVGGVSMGVQLCSTSSGFLMQARQSFIGLNAGTAIGIPLILGAFAWHLASKMPSTMTFWQKAEAVFQKILSYPKAAVTWFWKQWSAA